MRTELAKQLQYSLTTGTLENKMSKLLEMSTINIQIYKLVQK